MKPFDTADGIKSNITIQDEQESVELKKRQLELIEETTLKCLENVNLEAKCDINIILVNDENIRKLNGEFRKIDAATDVLSFPMLEMHEGDVEYEEGDLDMDTGLLLLGDIVISVETAARQAQEYGHSLDRDLAFLTSHGMFHLLGYDHEDETCARKMFDKQEEVLSKMGLQRK